MLRLLSSTLLLATSHANAVANISLAGAGSEITFDAGSPDMITVNATFFHNILARLDRLDADVPTKFALEYLIVAGGGGGGSSGANYCGGGGAGGYRSSVAGEASGGGASAEPFFMASQGVSHSVVVGSGGSAGSGTGGDSSFHSIVSLGGGGGRGNAYGEIILSTSS